MCTNQFIEDHLNTIICSELLFEDITMSEPDLQTYLQSGAHDQPVIDDLLAAWHYIIHHAKSSLDLSDYQTINRIVAAHDSLDPGQLRTGDSQVNLGPNVDAYHSPTIDAESLSRSISPNVLTLNQNLTQNLQLILQQPFWDGNKRTMFLAINWWSLMHNQSLIVIAPAQYPAWQTALTKAYQTGQIDDLRNWVLDYATFAAKN